MALKEDSTTIRIPKRTLQKLREKALTQREPHYSIIDRLTKEESECQ
jgi:hypothetical protein